MQKSQDFLALEYREISFEIVIVVQIHYNNMILVIPYEKFTREKTPNIFFFLKMTLKGR